MSRRDDLHHNSHQPRTMTASFLNETVDQEIQLADLQQVNGAIPVPVMVGLAWGSGWLCHEFWEENKEDIADAIHDFISDEKECENGNCSGYRQGGGSRGGGKYDKPVLR